MRVAVGRLKGTDRIDAELKSLTLTVRYEPSTVTVEAIQQALAMVGFESSVL